VRIGVLAPPWPIPPVDYGGIENAIDALCVGLTRAGHQVCLWSSPDSTVNVSQSSGTRLPVSDNGAWHSAPMELNHVLRGYVWLNEQGVDIVQDHTLAGAVMGNSLSACPVVVVNSLPFQPPAEAGAHTDVSAIYAEAAKRVPVIAISFDQASRSSVPVAAVLHHGTDFGSQYAVQGTSSQYVAVLGRMSPVKGIRQSIEAARDAGWPVRVAARMEEPDEYAYFRDVIEPMLERDADITYVGAVAAPERRALLKGAACLVNLLNWDEPFGLVMIESMAVGTPVVAARRGAALEVVDEGVTGRVVRSREQAARAIAAVTSELPRDRVWSHGVTRFGLDAYAERHLNFYRAVLKAG